MARHTALGLTSARERKGLEPKGYGVGTRAAQTPKIDRSKNHILKIQ